MLQHVTFFAVTLLHQPCLGVFEATDDKLHLRCNYRMNETLVSYIDSNNGLSSNVNIRSVTLLWLYPP